MVCFKNSAKAIFHGCAKWPAVRFFSGWRKRCKPSRRARVPCALADVGFAAGFPGAGVGGQGVFLEQVFLECRAAQHPAPAQGHISLVAPDRPVRGLPGEKFFVGCMPGQGCRPSRPPAAAPSARTGQADVPPDAKAANSWNRGIFSTARRSRLWRARGSGGCSGTTGPAPRRVRPAKPCSVLERDARARRGAG